MRSTEIRKDRIFRKWKSQWQESYKRDKLGRISYVAEKALGAYLLYDESGRFIGRRPHGAAKPSHENRYDGNGNRIYVKTPDYSHTATYDSQDRLMNFGIADYTYTINGDILTKTDSTTSETTSYTYDVFGNLKQVILPNSDVITYEIDGQNRRVAKRSMETFRPDTFTRIN